MYCSSRPNCTYKHDDESMNELDYELQSTLQLARAWTAVSMNHELMYIINIYPSIYCSHLVSGMLSAVGIPCFASFLSSSPGSFMSVVSVVSGVSVVCLIS